MNRACALVCDRHAGSNSTDKYGLPALLVLFHAAPISHSFPSGATVTSEAQLLCAVAGWCAARWTGSMAKAAIALCTTVALASTGIIWLRQIPAAGLRRFD
jgi:hypothetical protein